MSLMATLERERCIQQSDKLQRVTELLTFRNTDTIAKVHAQINEARIVLGVYDHTPPEEEVQKPYRSWYERLFR